jgi:oligopeptide/dipeptide ABC transporter ATP-binding protein
MNLQERDAGAALLDVQGLITRIPVEGGGAVNAVNGVSFQMSRGESLALVGESGSGKSMSALSILGLLPKPGRVTSGEARFEGRDLLTLPANDLRKVRGRGIGIVFQDPATSLNPVLTIGRQITEGLREHLQMTDAARRNRAIELLALVGIPDAKNRLASYPHEFSGGQRQRVLIAMAIACEPSLLIADEPTTALDATIQAQIVELLKGLQKRLGMAILWITHDLALVAGLVERVAVMYAGSIVEMAPVRDLFKHPRHPYTLGLLGAMPRTDARHDGGHSLVPIPGSPPDLREEIAGCAFAPRCPLATERCRAERPALTAVGPGHAAACFRSEEM